MQIDRSRLRDKTGVSSAPGGLGRRDHGWGALEGVAGEEAPEDRPRRGRQAVEAVVAAS